MTNNKLFFTLYHEIPKKYIYSFGDAVCMKTLRQAIKEVGKGHRDGIRSYIADVLEATLSKLNDLYPDAEDFYYSEGYIWPE